uniref:Ig-like domain-containing protein n=1 Tax=Anas platyrhynchos platyrhynchos TaxID=8840 RepID=A0A493TBM9_ANAPP
MKMVLCAGHSLIPVFSPLSSPSPGSLVQAALTQPDSKSVNLGDTVQITCSGGSGSYGWFQQKTPAIDPVTVIYGNTNSPSGIPSRFSGSASGSTATLTITGVQAEDQAVYFCGAWDGSTGHGESQQWGSERPSCCGTRAPQVPAAAAWAWSRARKCPHELGPAVWH